MDNYLAFDLKCALNACDSSLSNLKDKKGFADEDKLIISNDYQKQQIFDTIKSEETPPLFIYEVTNNGLVDADISTSFDRRHQYSENNFSNLAKNINLFEGLIHTQHDNLMRENEEQKHRRKAKNRKKKQKSKQANQQRGL